MSVRQSVTHACNRITRIGESLADRETGTDGIISTTGEVYDSHTVLPLGVRLKDPHIGARGISPCTAALFPLFAAQTVGMRGCFVVPKD